ncbi:AbrB/MazE/SpoVT family DNA-binding domain-containing protein [Providencia huaxiensis]|uniref:AbrB/MazE/SpoVT family DNA-binding domain-containing protein n=1 Tax=Providencia huaxiensis TaxID=2027290 RepID=UPI0034DDB11D
MINGSGHSKKWGNSPSVRLPVAIMQKAALSVDDTVEIAVEEGRIIITPVKAVEYSLENLLAGITPENIHESRLRSSNR